MQEAKKNRICLIRFLISIMLATMIVYCFGPTIDNIFGTYTKDVELRVVGKNEENGASEIWIAVDNLEYDLGKTVEYTTVNGKCEYRLASDYGYGFNFLISYGNNKDTELVLRNINLKENNLIVYKHLLGGIVEIKCGNDVQVINTYSSKPEVVNIDIAENSALSIGITFLKAVIVIIISMLIYKKIIPMLKNKDLVALSSKEDKRASINLIKCVASFLVILVHSFLAGGYYETPMHGEIMAILTFIRWIALNCVPLFMIATGYLFWGRFDVINVYKKIIPTYLLVVVVAIFSYIVNFFVYKTIVTQETIWNDLVSLHNSWYVAMYLGLLLLIPFLNKIWSGISYQYRKILIVSLFVLTSLPTINSEIPFPVYWVSLYPITYYFCGMALREGYLSAKNRVLIPLFIVTTLLQTLLSITNDPGGLFKWDLFGNYECNYNSLIVIVSSVLLFCILLNIRINNNILKKLLGLVGKNTLGVYLISVFITDNLVYKYFEGYYIDMYSFVRIQLLAVLMSFISAIIISIILTTVVSAIAIRIDIAINKLYNKAVI